MDALIQTLLISVLSPTILLFLSVRVFNLGELHQKFLTALDDIKELKKTVGKLSEEFRKLSMEMVVVKACLVGDLGVDSTLFDTNSPLSLEPKGKKLLKDSNFERIYKGNKKLFINKILKHKPSTKADIDEACISVMDDLKNDPLLANFKEVAFESGFHVELLLRVCSIYLREEAIKEIL